MQSRLAARWFRVFKCTLPLAVVGAIFVVMPRLSVAAPPKFDATKLAAIHDAMQKFVDQHELAGAVTVIGTSQGIVYHDAAGNLSLDSSTPMPKDALFRIASMTKPITAIGIMILADEGKLSVDDPLEKYLPEFRGQMLVASRDETAKTVTLKESPRPITLRDLLTHTSGLPPGYPKSLSEVRNRTLADGALVMSQQPLNYEPGAMWKYCSTGLDVLGRVIEVVSGKTYEDFLQERVFQPLGMRDTTFYPTPDQQKRLAQVCTMKDGQLVSAGLNVPTEKPKNPNPSGGLYSTGADLARLYQAMLHHGELDGKRILSEASAKTMTKTQTGDIKCGFTPGMSYGLGFGVVKDPQEVTEMLSPGTYGHGGSHGTQGWIDPTRDVFLILLIQRDKMGNADASPMRKEFQTLAVKAIQP